jgi:hypothetical protein
MRVASSRRRSASPARRNSVPGTADRLDQPVASALVNLPSKAPDVDLDDVRLRREVRVPEGIDEAVPREDLAGMSREELEERELARGEVDLAGGTPDAEGCRVELKVADLDPGRSLLEPAPTECPDPCAELVHAEWLGKVVVGAAIETGDAILNVVEGGEHEDRR